MRKRVFKFFAFNILCIHTFYRIHTLYSANGRVTLALCVLLRFFVYYIEVLIIEYIVVYRTLIIFSVIQFFFSLFYIYLFYLFSLKIFTFARFKFFFSNGDNDDRNSLWAIYFSFYFPIPQIFERTIENKTQITKTKSKYATIYLKCIFSNERKMPVECMCVGPVSDWFIFPLNWNICVLFMHNWSNKPAQHT